MRLMVVMPWSLRWTAMSSPTTTIFLNESLGGPQFAVHSVVKSNADDVLQVYALLFQVLFEEVEEQERLTAPSHAGNHFYHAVMLS